MVAPRASGGMDEISSLGRSLGDGLSPQHGLVGMAGDDLGARSLPGSRLWRNGLNRNIRARLSAGAFADTGPDRADGFDASASAADWLADARSQCSRTELSVARDGRLWRRALPCRCWKCTACARKLRYGVMCLAASGAPNRMVTLTISPKVEPDPINARLRVHKAWRTLRLTIARELARPIADRWKTRTPAARARRAAPNQAAPPAAPKLKPPALPYFAVVERHKSGHPHLHLLLRCGYVPQRWLSAQMRRLAGSPIVDIRKVSSSKHAAGYVAKYLGKAPARFAGSRAYWYSRNYSLTPAGEQPTPVTQPNFFSARPRLWSETVSEVQFGRPIIDLTEDGWFSLQPRAAPLGAFIYRNRFPPIWRSARQDE